jgi:5-methylcytosine-specific restriction endonuclease McrA
MASVMSPPHSKSPSLDEHRRRGLDGGRVLVLNATFEPINVCTVRRAIVLLLKARAEVLEQGAVAARRARAFARPFVIRLTNYVRVPRDAHRRKITRRAVFARDEWTCQYCGARSNLTVDHVIPRSKGGRRAGTTSSPRARRATAARATARRCRPGCTPHRFRASLTRRDLHPRLEPDDSTGLARLPACAA